MLKPKGNIMDHPTQHQLFKAMEKPGFYPYPVSSIVRQKDTHISKVFLAGDYAYKIKKPLDLGFLDFTTLDKRNYYCNREVLLNRRLTHDIYLGVVPITHDNGIYSMGGKGDIVEYAVRMRCLPDHCSLKRMIGNRKINTIDMYALGWKLAEFYIKTPESNAITPEQAWQNVHVACEQNYRKINTCHRALLSDKKLAATEHAAFLILKNRKSEFKKRFENGKLKDCHGDLRSGHIYFTNKGIQIIDCIEFNDGLRHIDIASDLAFLLMDLDFHDKPEFADCLLNGYLRYTGDFKAFSFLNFYKCYRALVRCKVDCILLDSPGIPEDEAQKILNRAQRYLDLAFGYAGRFSTPLVWVVCGLPGTGKSTIAKALAEIFDIKLIRSDVVRKELFGLQPHDTVPAGVKNKLYSSEATAMTYQSMLDLAGKKLDHKAGVILDATYSLCGNRTDVVERVKTGGGQLVFIECKADEAIIMERLLARKSRPSVSDAGPRHFDMLKERFDAFGSMDMNGDIEPIVVDTSFPLDQTLSRILIKAFRIRPGTITGDRGN